MYRNVLNLFVTAAALACGLYAQGTSNDCSSATAGLLSVVRPLNVQAAADCPTLVGTWEVQVSPDGVPTFTAFNVFYADGNSLEFDNSNPPGAQTSAVGPWQKVGHKQYAFVEVNQVFDEMGNYAGKVVVRANVTLDDSGDKFTSIFKVSASDPDGNVQFEATGTAIGKRMKVGQVGDLAM